MYRGSLKVTSQNQADSNEEMVEWTGVIQKLNDNQSLCNSLIKKKADEILKTDTKVDGNEEPGKKTGKSGGKIKEYKQEAEFAINSQYGSWDYCLYTLLTIVVNLLFTVSTVRFIQC